MVQYFVCDQTQATKFPLSGIQMVLLLINPSHWICGLSCALLSTSFAWILQKCSLGCIIVWQPKHPDMKYFVEEIKELQNGFDVSINQVSVRFFLQIQRHLADLPGKAMSLNMKQFNGSFGCSMCLHPGKMLEGSRSTRVYPFNPNPTPHRNCTDSILHAQIAERTGITTFGFKGKSPA